MGLDIEAFELQGAGLGGVKDVRPDGGHLEALPIDDRVFPSGVLPLNGFSPGSGQIRKGVAPDVDGIEPVVDAVLNPDGLTEEDGPLVRLDDRLELGGSGRIAIAFGRHTQGDGSGFEDVPPRFEPQGRNAHDPHRRGHGSVGVAPAGRHRSVDNLRAVRGGGPTDESKAFDGGRGREIDAGVLEFEGDAKGLVGHDGIAVHRDGGAALPKGCHGGGGEQQGQQDAGPGMMGSNQGRHHQSFSIFCRLALRRLAFS